MTRKYQLWLQLIYKIIKTNFLDGPIFSKFNFFLQNFCQNSEENSEPFVLNQSRRSSLNSPQNYLFSPNQSLNNRSISSPDLFRLSVLINGSTSSSIVSSPMPTNNDLSNVSLLFQYPSSKIKTKSLSSNESLNLKSSKKAIETNPKINLKRPQVKILLKFYLKIFA